MRLKSTADRYGAMIIAIHWLTAALIIILLASGFRAADAADAATKAAILRAHIPIAIAVLTLTLVRLVWWWGFDRKPIPVAGSPHWQARSAQAVHLAFYVIILGMIASGVGMLALSGAAPVIFGGSGALPDFWSYRPRFPHGIGARLLVALLILHVGAALYHQFVRRDGLIRRMWFGS
jgi:cytochrome b561